MKRREAAFSLAAGVWLAAAWIALADLRDHGAGLSAWDSLASLALWLSLASPVAFAAAVLGHAIGGLRSADRAIPRLLGLSLAAAGFTAYGGGLAGPGTAIGLTALGFFVAMMSPFRPAPWLAAGLVLSVPASLVVAPDVSAVVEKAPRPGVSGAQPAATAAARHVVLIVLDTLRADHLGAYGHPGGLSPVFDRLATQGRLFERCYAPAPWTVPSHASLFTGLPPRTHGASFEHHRWLDDGFQTVAEGLAAAGYRTLGLSANQYVELANLHQGFDRFATLGAARRRLALRRPLSILGGPARWIDEGAAAAPAELDALLGPETAEAPSTFLFLNLLEPHWRHLPPAAERARALPPDLSGLAAARLSSRYYGPLAMAGAPLAPRTLEAVRALYAAEVAYQDAALERILEVIDRRLGLDRSLLVVTADHGENLGEAGRFDHVFAVNDHLIHVPMLVRAPDGPRGRREAGLCQLTDVPATVRAWTGAPSVPSGRGRDLLDDPFTGPPFVLAEGDPFYGHLERMSVAAGPERDVAQFTARLLAVSDGDFKLVRSSRTGDRLHEMASDPDEERDVSAEHPERLEALRKALAAFLEREPAYRDRVGDDGSAGGMSPEQRRLLESLGYLDD